MQPSRLSLLLTATLLLAPAFAAQAQRVVEGDLQGDVLGSLDRNGVPAGCSARASRACMRCT